MKPSRFPYLVTALVLIFLHLPILFLVVNSFNSSRFSSTWGSFTFEWYEKLFDSRNRDLWSATRLSLGIATVSSLVAMILGSFSAAALHWFRGQLQNAHFSLVYLPILIPDLLMGISLLIFFAACGVALGSGTILLAHITFCASFVTVVILARLQDFDESVIAAARDLGATRFEAIRKILIPLLAPGIIAGGMLAFTLSIDDFVITFFVSGPGSSTLPLKVYSMVKHSRELPLINALSTLLLTLTFAAVWWSRRLESKYSNPAESVSLHQPHNQPNQPIQFK